MRISSGFRVIRRLDLALVLAELLVCSRALSVVAVHWTPFHMDQVVINPFGACLNPGSPIT